MSSQTSCSTSSELELLRCPACRARLSSDEEERPCRRCGSDLSLLRQTYDLARSLQKQARRALATGRDQEALRCARRAVTLVDVEETRATLAAAFVALGRPRAALDVLDPS